MADLFENHLKRKLKEGKRALGAWLQIASPLTAEIMASAGFDWLVIDMEHGPGDMLTLVSQIHAIKSSHATPVVRAPWNDFVAIKRILDAGAWGLLIPYVNSKAEAQAAVRACKYPPEGNRGIAGSPRAAGYGLNPNQYLQRANDQILVITQVETFEAVSNLDQILEVPGLDGVYIGPMDLSTSMGHLGNPRHPEVQKAISTIEAKTLAAKKILGTLMGDWEQAKPLFEKGYQMVSCMADGVALARLATENVSRFREHFPEG